MGKGYLFTSESVTEGHPDKIADQISDGVLDAYLREDSYARVACEVLVTTDTVYIAGEISSVAEVDIEAVARGVIQNIGYTGADNGFSAYTCRITVNVDEQSRDIANGVNVALESRGVEEVEVKTGAGDQGIMFGYATNETDAYLPYPIYYAHRLAEKLSDVRKQDKGLGIKADGKTQVTVKYNEDGTIDYIDTIIVSVQHESDKTQKYLRDLILNKVIVEVIEAEYITEETKLYVNPSGRFVTGGPQGDVGLTGRKIIVDTYGGWSRHGGGAFSGKDATKVDRSATYMARYLSKNIVAAGLADKCEIQLAYAIGKAEPVSIYVDTFGTSKGVSEREIEEKIIESFRLDPEGIIEKLELRKPVFLKTAAYGHFGRAGFKWEELDSVDVFKEIISK